MTTTHAEMIAALSQLDEIKEQLPTHCPRWCVDQHVQAIEEGCTLPGAAEHRSREMTGRHYRLAISQEHKPLGWASARVDLEIDGPDDRPSSLRVLHLATCEARTLAAQLIHLADLEELTDNGLKRTTGRER